MMDFVSLAKYVDIFSFAFVQLFSIIENNSRIVFSLFNNTERKKREFFFHYGRKIDFLAA